MLKLFTLAFTASTLLMAVPAQAEFRWLPRLWFQDDEPRRQAYYDEDEDVIIVRPSRQQASIYDDALDESFYEPKIMAPVRKQIVKKSKVDPAPVKKISVATPKLTPAKPAAPKVAGVNCEKGAVVVVDYGFSGVKSKTCDAKILVFSAVRSGKPYEVSVSAMSGEITEVRKVQ